MLRLGAATVTAPVSTAKYAPPFVAPPTRPAALVAWAMKRRLANDSAPSDESETCALHLPGCDGDVSRARSSGFHERAVGLVVRVVVYATQTWSTLTLGSPTTNASNSTWSVPTGFARTSTNEGGSVSELVAGVR